MEVWTIDDGFGVAWLQCCLICMQVLWLTKHMKKAEGVGVDVQTGRKLFRRYTHNGTEKHLSECQFAALLARTILLRCGAE